ncbi:glycosyl hydrolase family protein with chitinase insertion domain-containing protein [Artemisia annua]|uniref:Glycosyl hydrolase family protein with chitinase insertion domain-containing protein n=1 Tax=Artemisia annua TaxID=35608 RepID=A0A2U1N1A8_ARTAN|nr:glycosyl hydrolase family protein with chitinase insertion domain-containing protein [Artemisia annua]
MQIDNLNDIFSTSFSTAGNTANNQGDKYLYGITKSINGCNDTCYHLSKSRDKSTMATRRITFFFLATILYYLFNHGETVSFAVASKPNILVSSTNEVLLQYQGVRGAYWPSFTGYPASSIDTSYFSHIYYAFVRPSPTTYALNVTDSDVEKLLEFAKSSKRWNPPAKTLLAIGGGGGRKLSDIFSQMASQKYSRTSFIKSTIKVARDYNFDGIDLDWESPSSKLDMSNLGMLFNEWRQALENEAKVTRNPRLILTSAVYYASRMPYDGEPRSYPIQEIRQYVDWISPMCYDYHGEWEKFTGLHSALYDPNSNLNTDFGIRSWIKAGVPPKQIVMGLPLYGPTWSLKDPKVNTVGAPTTGTGPGNGILVYSKVVDFNRKNNATIVFDNRRISFYSYAGDSWISYDDVRSIKSKVQYARDQLLGGYFFWALGQDLDWAISSKASQAWLT